MLADLKAAIRAAVREFKRLRWKRRNAQRWSGLPF
jgi:hypothetical protein